MGRFIDETAAQKCLAELMARRDVKSWLKTAFDANDFEQLLADTPTVEDVVEVVRCKDCKHMVEHHYEEPGEPPYIKCTCENMYGLTKSYRVEPSDYCSRGERREDNA